LAGEVSDDAWEWLVVLGHAYWDRRRRRAGSSGGTAGADVVGASLCCRVDGGVGSNFVGMGCSARGSCSWTMSGRVRSTGGIASGFREASHRPDLIVLARTGGRFAVEVELTKKSVERLRAILARHALWRTIAPDRRCHLRLRRPGRL